MIILGGYSYYYYQSGVLYLTLNDGKTKVQIPREIVRDEDCTKYKIWFEKHFTPMMARSNRCPWAKVKGAIAEFVLNGVNFYIPREYLWQNSREPDGEVESINLMFKYPEMTSATGGEANRDYNVRVSLESTYQRVNCREENICDQVGQEKYEHNTGIDWNNKNNKPNIIKKLYELPKENLTAYEINNKHDFLIKGDPLRPDYWLDCDGGKYGPNFHPHCETYTNYNNKFYLNYFFSRHFLLEKHDDVKAKILEKINQFQQTPSL